MSSQSVLLKSKGLYSFPNRISAIPEGALLRASNIIINRDEIAESRRGYKIYGNEMGSGSSNTAHQLLDYKGRILRHYGSGPGEILEFDNGSGTFAAFSIQLDGDTTDTSTTIQNIVSTAQLSSGMFISGSGIPNNTTVVSITDNNTIEISNAATATATVTLTFTYKIEEVDTGLRIKGVEQNGNFYFTTSEGIKKISVANAGDLSSASITQAGGVKALDFTANINNNPGFFEPSSVIAYRIVWGIKDANQNLILGTPSSRVVIRNTDTVNSKTVDINITIPRNVTTAYFYQVYRTAVFADPTGDQDPGDEQRLVYENNPTTMELDSGFLSVTDITPDSFRGANLYTNADTGEGILQANDIPPLSHDITSFRGYTFFSNTETLQRLNISLLSVSEFLSGTSSLSISDGTTTNTYTFTSTDFTGDIHSGTRIIDNIADTSILDAGLSIFNANLADNTYIVRIIDGTSIEISQDGLASASAETITAATEDVTNKFVALSQFTTPSQQVDETARSLIRIINAQDGEIVNAFYLSGPDDVPGLILLEARTLNQNAFYLNVDDATTTGIEFSPNIPDMGTDVISDNEVFPNRLYYSKYSQPEAVPIVNFIDVGPKDKAIERIIGLRDNLFILKEEGVYRLSGLVAPFQVYPFDLSVNIQAADSAVALNNLIYVFTNQGVSTISDSGVAVISRPIEDEIIALPSPQYSNFTTATFGVSYESDRSYYLFTVTDTTDTFATQCFRFNTFTQTWTLLDLSKRSGIVNFADDKLYLGPNDTNFIEQERKFFNRTDYADREFVRTLGSNKVNGTVIELPTLSEVHIGDVITQVQYLTITQYNRLLMKLDNDSFLSPHDYVSTLTLSAGANLTNAMDSLISKIAADPGRQSIPGFTAAATYTALLPTPSTFSGQQTKFNSLIALLNNDVGVSYSNYMGSSGTILYELPILSFDTEFNTITTNFSYPLIEGDVTLYNHIATDLQFVPQYFSDPSMSKQVSEGTFIFEDASFSNITALYSSDLSADFESIAISSAGVGLFGNSIYGEGVYGGNGRSVPFRTYIPRNKQRCRYINARFQHAVAREIFYFYGISLTYVPTSQRAYR